MGYAKPLWDNGQSNKSRKFQISGEYRFSNCDGIDIWYLLNVLHNGKGGRG
jgi:hypothetical protein